MDVSFRQLQYFDAVAQTGSVKAAADQCHVSASSVSLSISQLESALGVQLTRRSRRLGTSLTPAGRAAATQVSRIIREVDRLAQVVGRSDGELTGTLHLGCSDSLSPWMLPRILSYFHFEHSAVDMAITEGNAPELQQQVRDGLLDCCLIHSAHVEPDMAARVIAPLRLHVVLPASHRLAKRTEVSVTDLAGETAVLLDHQPALSVAHSMFRTAGVSLEVGWLNRNVETVRALVARGLGFTLLMGRPAGDVSYDGLGLAYRPLREADSDNAVVVCTLRDVRDSRLTASLVECCRSEFDSERPPTEGPIDNPLESHAP